MSLRLFNGSGRWIMKNAYKDKCLCVVQDTVIVTKKQAEIFVPCEATKSTLLVVQVVSRGLLLCLPAL